MGERRKERGIWEFGREEGRQRYIGIWERREERGMRIYERREERGIWEYGREEGRERIKLELEKWR